MRGGRAQPLVILTPGSVGDLVFVRLLTAGGSVRCSGQLLENPVKDPAKHALRVLTRAPGGEPVHAGLVHPDHLWMWYDAKPETVIEEWRNAGVRFVVLGRQRFVDRGLSREVCGALELLPLSPVAVSAHGIVIAAEDAAPSWDWARRTATGAEVIAFEADLATPEARQATVDRLATWLGVPAWTAPPEDEVPTGATLWSLAIDAERAQAEVKRLLADVGRDLGPVDA